MSRVDVGPRKPARLGPEAGSDGVAILPGSRRMWCVRVLIFASPRACYSRYWAAPVWHGVCDVSSSRFARAIERTHEVTPMPKQNEEEYDDLDSYEEDEFEGGEEYEEDEDEEEDEDDDWDL